MSEAINGSIAPQELTATLGNSPGLSATLGNNAGVGAQLTPGGIIMNDYRLTVSDIDGGKRLTVKRGNEVQQMDIMNGVSVMNISISEVD